MVVRLYQFHLESCLAESQCSMRKFFLVLTLALALASAETTEDKEDAVPEEIVEEIKASDEIPENDGGLRNFEYYNTVHGPHRGNSHGDYRPPNFAPSNIGYGGGGYDGGYGGGYGGSYPNPPPQPSESEYDFPKPNPPPSCNCKDIVDQIDDLDEKIIKSLLDLEIKADGIQRDVGDIHKETESVAFVSSQTQLIANAVDNQLNIVRQNLTIIKSDVE